MVADLEQQLRSDPAVDYTELLQKQRENKAVANQTTPAPAENPTPTSPTRQFAMLQHIFEPASSSAVNKELPKMMTKARPIDLTLRSENRKKQADVKIEQGGQ